MAYFPLFINLEGREVLVIGGGTVACRRILSLSEFGCRIRVIAPEAGKELKEAFGKELRPLLEDGRLLWMEKSYDEEDLFWDGQTPVFVLSAAAKEVNERVFLDCKRRKIPVNNASNKEESDFYFPGIAREGDLVAGVTASGKDHKKAAEFTAAVRKLMRGTW